jgi:hypothetical protein
MTTTEVAVIAFLLAGAAYRSRPSPTSSGRTLRPSVPRRGSATSPPSSTSPSTRPRRCGRKGSLADKPSTAFTSAINAHGGNESTFIALYDTMYHWGTVIVRPGYTDSAVDEAGGKPVRDRSRLRERVAHAGGARRSARQGARLADVAGALIQVRATRQAPDRRGGQPDELVRCRRTPLPRWRARSRAHRHGADGTPHVGPPAWIRVHPERVVPLGLEAGPHRR